SPDLRWHRATALLLRGDYARGWPEHEARKSIRGGAIHREFPYPEWDGAPLGDGALLVYAEQGVGDEIMFASCIPDLAARGVHCVLECAPRLASLFGRSFPAVTVHGAARDGSRDWLGAYPALRAQSAIGSLPRFLRNAPEAFPARGGYLVPDARRTESWRARLAALGPGIKIGISWRGGTPKTRGRLRSMAPAELQPLLALEHARFVSLQYGAPEPELPSPLTSWPEAVADLDETA